VEVSSKLAGEYTVKQDQSIRLSAMYINIKSVCGSVLESILESYLEVNSEAG
jgi:hypothetical protein